jgi:hypothetical protein
MEKVQKYEVQEQSYVPSPESFKVYSEFSFLQAASKMMKFNSIQFNSIQFLFI